MGFRDMKAAFEKDMSKFEEEGVFRFWLLRLLFEIAGNLDSLVVTNRKAEEHVDKMATAYSELVAIQKEKMGRNESK